MNIYRFNIYTLPDTVEMNIFCFEVILALKKFFLRFYVHIFWLTKVLHFKC